MNYFDVKNLFRYNVTWIKEKRIKEILRYSCYRQEFESVAKHLFIDNYIIGNMVTNAISNFRNRTISLIDLLMKINKNVQSFLFKKKIIYIRLYQFSQSMDHRNANFSSIYSYFRIFVLLVIFFLSLILKIITQKCQNVCDNLYTFFFFRLK